MAYKLYKTKRDNKINNTLTIPKGSIIEIDWEGMDGAWWRWDGYQGCPFIDTDVEEVTMLDFVKSKHTILQNQQTRILEEGYHYYLGDRYFVVYYQTPFGKNYSIWKEREHITDYKLFNEIVDSIENGDAKWKK